MKNLRLLATTLLLAPPLLFLNGCGGGGSGSSGTPTPSPSPPPTVGARVLVVQLRDGAGQPVDGVVTVGTTTLATSGGSAVFNRNLAAGATVVSAEVDGEITTATATVQSSGSTIITVLIVPRVTPVPSGTLPPPPFPS